MLDHGLAHAPPHSDRLVGWVILLVQAQPATDPPKPFTGKVVSTL